MIACSRNVMRPQFSSPPAEKSGIAKRSDWTEHEIMSDQLYLYHCDPGCLVKLQRSHEYAGSKVKRHGLQARGKCLKRFLGPNAHLDRNLLSPGKQNHCMCKCRHVNKHLYHPNCASFPGYRQ